MLSQTHLRLWCASQFFEMKKKMSLKFASRKLTLKFALNDGNVSSAAEYKPNWKQKSVNFNWNNGITNYSINNQLTGSYLLSSNVVGETSKPSKFCRQKQKIWFFWVCQFSSTKGQPGALKLPHTQGLGRGPTIWCTIRSLTLFLHKRLFPRLEPVTLQSHDNNFTSCVKVQLNDN